MKLSFEVTNVRSPETPRIIKSRTPVMISCDAYEEGNSHLVTIRLPKWVATKMIEVIQQELGR